MKELSRKLLIWYGARGRDLPWRVKGGAHSDPYAVWVSEIMLQQTTVATVIPYFIRWMEKFPSVEDLAAASVDDVLNMWQGLGYYTRAKKLHECAVHLVEKEGGKFPDQREKLLRLPGVGPYTASSLCAFAFNQPETVVDGNVIRVLSRVYGIEEEVDAPFIYPMAVELTPETEGADYASAIMDLGATICKPKNPLCPQCPWAADCVAYKKGIQEQIPVIRKLEKKKKHGAVYIMMDGTGKFLIQKRGGKGLLSGLWELPWTEDGIQFPIKGDWEKTAHRVRHVFTHFDLTLDVYYLEKAKADGIFISKKEIPEYAFSTLMKKVLSIIPEMY